MRAIVVTDRSIAKLALVDRPAPRPRPGELLVRVRAAGVNPVDWKARSGLPGRLVSEVPGLDIAGVVEEAQPSKGGAPEADFPRGTPVLGLTRQGGGYAELAVLPRTAAVRKPEELRFEDAAAIPCAGLTALLALRDQAKLRAGQRLLVNGAAGGVGTFAVQLGRALGATVTAVTSARNAELVASLGAERVIDYAKDDFTHLPDEYDVIFDAVAGRSFAACRGRLAPGGAYVTTLPGPADVGWAVASRVGVLGGQRAYVTNALHGVSRANLAYLARLAVEGRVKPVVERVLPLVNAAKAFAESRAGHVRGKLVLSL
jgi:NADPH:quinone reductase-like Zn-dependent oxidoreductase